MRIIYDLYAERVRRENLSNHRNVSVYVYIYINVFSLNNCKKMQLTILIIYKNMYKQIAITVYKYIPQKR